MDTTEVRGERPGGRAERRASKPEVVARPDRVGKKYIGGHFEPSEHRRARVVTAKLGWTMDAFVRFGFFYALEKLEKMAEEDDGGGSS